MITRYTSCLGQTDGELTENLNDDIETSSKRYTVLWPVMITGVVSTFVYIAYLLQGSPLIAITIFGISLLQLMPPVIIKRYMQIDCEDCRKIEAKITDQITEAVKWVLMSSSYMDLQKR